MLAMMAIGVVLISISAGKSYKNHFNVFLFGIICFVISFISIIGICVYIDYQDFVISTTSTILPRNKYEIIKSHTPNLMFVVVDVDNIITVKDSKYYLNPNSIVVNDTLCIRRNHKFYHQYTLR